MELDLQVGPEEIVGRWSWAAKVGLLSFRVVPQQQCNGHCPCDSAQAWQLKQQLRSAVIAGQWRGDTALTLPLFWRRSTVSPVFFGRYPRTSFHSFVPVPNKPPRSIFRLPPAFVVWSFFLCLRHLWSVLSFFATGICVQSLSFTAFSAIGIRVRLFVFALLALVSGYQCISQFLRLLLVSFILGDSNLYIFQVGYLWTALQIPL